MQAAGRCSAQPLRDKLEDRMQTDGQTHRKNKLLFDEIKGCRLVGRPRIAFN